MKSWILIPLLTVVFLIAGCATTRFYSQMNFDLRGFKYQRILIQFKNQNPDDSLYEEQTAQEEIAKVFGPGILCYLYSREFYAQLKSTLVSDEELGQFLRTRNIDGILVCDKGQIVTRDILPVSDGVGLVATNNQYENWARCHMELVDVRSRVSVWYANASSNSYLKSYEGMTMDLIHKSIKDMKDHDLLGPNHR